MNSTLASAQRIDSHVPTYARKFIRVADLSILPLLLAMPFVFFPKLLEGDTQPWILLGGLVAFFGFRLDQFISRRDLFLVALCTLCVVSFGFRSAISADFLRALYLHTSFLVFWIVIRRAQGDYWPNAIRLTIAVWFAVGVYQTFALAYGLPVTFSGRFIEGRGGVPSLASEPSAYGSLSIIQMMYLLGLRQIRDRKYILMAGLSVVLSGSLLALGLLAFPLMRMRGRTVLTVLLAFGAVFAAKVSLGLSGLGTRLASFSLVAGFVDILLDESLNLRFGHVYFTMRENLMDSLLFLSPLAFQQQYNEFARNTPWLIETTTNFVLPSAGDLIYGSGIFGLGLVITLITYAWRNGRDTWTKVQRTLFVAACLVNPVSFANVYLLIYIQRKE